MIETPPVWSGTLELAVMHLVGQSRAYVHYLESALAEVGSLKDERAAGVVEALSLTLREPIAPGTLRHVERAASQLLREL